MKSTPYISTLAFARLSGITRQAAHLALSRAYKGKRRNGHRLIARRVHGQGGNAGWSYEVEVGSLPLDLQAKLRADPTLLPAARSVPAEIDDPGDIARWRYDVIEPALRHSAGSWARGKEMTAAAVVTRTHPSGRRAPVSVRTIRNWIAAYEQWGMAGLRDKTRSDRGNRRNFVTGAWDASVPFPDETKSGIADETLTDVRSLWAANTEYGWRWVARMASAKLQALTVAAGFDPGPDELRRICKLTRSFVERGRRYRAVAVHDKDHKLWFDKHRPRIMRTVDPYRPNGVVVVDVHHVLPTA